MYYAGIGSRETPNEYLRLFRSVAKYLAEHSTVLRSGGAAGADSAFEKGCDSVYGPKEIYIPWPGFNGLTSEFCRPSEKALQIASTFHPKWEQLNQGAQKLHARNAYQILGQNLETPSSFVICYTKGGSGAGGTGQALRMAKHFNIPIFDAGCYKTMEDAHAALREFVGQFVEK